MTHDKQCKQFYTQDDLPTILEEFEGINYPDMQTKRREMLYKNYTTSIENPKIPNKTHWVWFTNQEKPKEIPGRDLGRVMQSLATLHNSGLEWEYNFWTNNASLIPHTLNSIEPYDVQIRSLHEAPSLQEIRIAFDSAIDKHHYGTASDISRFVILKDFGGIYLDVDVGLHTAFEQKFLNSIDFFAYKDPLHGINCGLTGAKPNHPISAQMISNFAQNLKPDTDKEYLICTENNQQYTMLATGPDAQSIAFHQKSWH